MLVCAHARIHYMHTYIHTYKGHKVLNETFPSSVIAYNQYTQYKDHAIEIGHIGFSLSHHFVLPFTNSGWSNVFVTLSAKLASQSCEKVFVFTDSPYGCMYVCMYVCM
jgi:hypothetical protein